MPLVSVFQAVHSVAAMSKVCVMNKTGNYRIRTVKFFFQKFDTDIEFTDIIQ